MKAVLISIQPKWVAKIASGEKTIEVRKTKPNLQTPFKCYIYCTQCSKKGVPLLVGKDGQVDFGDYRNACNCDCDGNVDWFIGEGKVIGEFVCKGIMRPHDSLKLMSKQSCVTEEELFEYSNGKTLYGWRIADLKIYDKPKELSEFYAWKKCNSCRETGYESTACVFDEECKVPYKIARPPQSYMFVEELQNG